VNLKVTLHGPALSLLSETFDDGQACFASPRSGALRGWRASALGVLKIKPPKRADAIRSKRRIEVKKG